MPPSTFESLMNVGLSPALRSIRGSVPPAAVPEPEFTVEQILWLDQAFPPISLRPGVAMEVALFAAGSRDVVETLARKYANKFKPSKTES